MRDLSTVCIFQRVHNAAVGPSISGTCPVVTHTGRPVCQVWANIVEIWILSSGHSAGQRWKYVHQIRGCQPQRGHLRWQLCANWAHVHLMLRAVPVLSSSEARARCASVAITRVRRVRELHVVVIFDLAFWSANPPEALPSRMGMLRAPPHNVLLNALHRLDSSIFPGKMSNLPWSKLKLATTQFKSRLAHRKLLNFSPWPFRSHPGIP